MARGMVSAAKIMISDVPRLSVLVAGLSVSERGDKNGGRAGKEWGARPSFAPFRSWW